MTHLRHSAASKEGGPLPRWANRPTGGSSFSPFRFLANVSPLFTCLGRLLAACWFLMTPVHVFAQSVRIGNTAPAASAALDIVRSAKGVLLPRVADTTALATPAPACWCTSPVRRPAFTTTSAPPPGIGVNSCQKPVGGPSHERMAGI
jgi:hypothetical protein